MIEGEYSVQNALYALLATEIAQTPDVRFQMLLPLGTDISSMLMRLWQINGLFSVDQLFCFPTTADNDCSQSVHVLQQIIPLCLIARDSYHPYYFYERTGTLAVNPLNYYIITPHYLVLLSQDQSAALFQCSKSLVRHFSDHFKSLMERCEPLISCASNLAEVLDKSNSLIDLKGCLYLNSQPCFGHYYTPELIVKYFQAQNCPLPGILEASVEHFSLLQKVEKNFCTIFSEKGLQYFMETGILTEVPQKYITAVDVKDRLYLLTRLRDDIAEEKVIGLIARPSYLRVPEYLTLTIDSGGNAYFDTTSAFQGGAFYCNIHISEKSICQAFKDFFQSLPGSQMVYSREDTLRMLDEGIRKLSSTNSQQE